MNTTTVLNIASPLIQKSGQPTKLKINSMDSSRMACYRLEKQCIYINSDKCMRQYEQLQQDGYHFRDRTQFIQMIVAHEIGHSLDPQLLFLSKQEEHLIDELKYCETEAEMENTFISLGELIIRIENNAWEYAQPFLPADLDQQTLEQYRMFALESYIYGLEGMKQQLMAYLA